MPFALCLLFSCANQGTLTGGTKDEKPPEVLTSVPANFSTHFKSDRIEITFNEYFALKDIAKQLVVSPPMTKKPEFKVKGKSLEIIFKDSLQPDRTYAINFGDAVVDLNEGNPIKNFQYVFSTGSTIDSLEVSGKVVQSLDNKPEDNILVMLYSGTVDSLPLKTIPLYLSRTNKEGIFTLRNLAGGSYKIFALKDGNNNLIFDQPTEAVAFQDSLITPWVIDAPVADTLPADSAKPAAETVITVSAKTQKSDSTKVDSTKIIKPKYLFKPDNIDLRLFTEVKPNQYLAGADRLRKDQIRLRFNEKIDSLSFEFLNLPMDSVAVSLEWFGDPDTLDFWIMNRTLAARDSLTALLIYKGYDSIERPISKTDTVKLRYREIAKTDKKPKNEFTVSASVERTKTLDYGQSINFITSLPYTQIDTSLIRVYSGKDALPRIVAYKMTPDTLKGFRMNGVPIQQVHPRMLRLHATFAADTSYTLLLLPGAFIGISDQKNDSLKIVFKMKARDQYGTAKIALPKLKGQAIVELIDASNKVAATRIISGPGKVEFDLISPGKYTARLTFDANQNGRWDTGRYIRHIQPEKVITFTKELNLKANWEVSETWEWEDL